jgi:hypothetical protein
MRRSLLAAAVGVAVIGGGALARADEFYSPGACLVDAASNGISWPPDWVWCLMSATGTNVDSKSGDWTLNVQFSGFNSLKIPKNCHYTVERSLSDAVFYLGLGKWMSTPGRFSQCDPSKMLDYYAHLGLPRVLRCETLDAPMPTMDVDYRSLGSDCR